MQKKVYSAHILAMRWEDFALKLPSTDMEIIDDDAERANIQFVKINDKRLGKSFGIKKFPALTMIRFVSIKNLLKIICSIWNQFNQALTLRQGPCNRNRDVFIYEGDLKDEETVLEFLTGGDSSSS